jgi:hypothetical protein
MLRDCAYQIAYIFQCFDLLVRESELEFALHGHQNADMLQAIPTFNVLRGSGFGYLANVLIIDHVDYDLFYLFKEFLVGHQCPWALASLSEGILSVLHRRSQSRNDGKIGKVRRKKHVFPVGEGERQLPL